MERRRFPDVSAAKWNADVSAAGAPTSDDVMVTADGRRLDTPDKVRSFLEELAERRRDRVLEAVVD